MTVRPITVTTAAALALALAACKNKEEGAGAGEPAKQPEPAAKAQPAPTGAAGSGGVAAAAGIEPKPMTAVGAGPAAGPESQCRAILAKAWDAIQPALATIGVDPAKVEKAYKDDGSFVERCAALDDTARGCLEAAANPVLGIHECKVNEGKQGSDKLWAPSVRVRGMPGEHLLDEQAERLAAAVGTWTSEWKGFEQKTTWVIAADGTVKETKERKGKKEEATYQLTFDRVDQVKVQTTPTSSQWYVWVQTDAKTAYVSNNLTYGAYPVKDVRKMTTWVGEGWLVVDGDACQVVSERAEVVDATCTWKKQGKTPVLTVDYQLPGRTRPDGAPSPSKLTFHHVGDYLLDERLVDIGTFHKK